jgi:hypothetical protein
MWRMVGYISCDADEMLMQSCSRLYLNVAVSKHFSRLLFSKTKKKFRCRESNPGLLGESQIS